MIVNAVPESLVDNLFDCCRNLSATDYGKRLKQKRSNPACCGIDYRTFLMILNESFWVGITVEFNHNCYETVT
jgi:hypothetical protein